MLLTVVKQNRGHELFLNTYVVVIVSQRYYYIDKYSLKPEQTVESNHSADRVRNKRLSSYFAVGCVQYKNGVDLVEVSIFYKSDKTNGHQ